MELCSGALLGLERATGRKRGSGAVPGPGDSLRDGLESALIGVLLLAALVAAVSGSGHALFVTVVAAWILLPFVVGIKNVLDAGCAFMLITIGILLVVGLARYGPGYLLP